MNKQVLVLLVILAATCYVAKCDSSESSSSESSESSESVESKESVQVISTRSRSAYGTVIQCDPKPGDIMLYQRHFEDSGSTLKKKKRTVYYPEKEDPAHSTINCIKAYDNIGATSTNGGTFKVVSGGLGQSSIIMKITSQRGYGYDYDIELWGQPLGNKNQENNETF